MSENDNREGIPYQKRYRVQPEIRIIHTLPAKRSFGNEAQVFGVLLAR